MLIEALWQGLSARSAGLPPLPEASCGTVGAAKRGPTAAGSVLKRTGIHNHTHECDMVRRARDTALAEHKARGGRGQDFNKMPRETLSWINHVPGLSTELELLAWEHRDENPFIRISSTNQGAVDGSKVRVEMIPRSVWDVDQRFLDACPVRRYQLRQIFDQSSFCQNTPTICVHSNDAIFQGQTGVSSQYHPQFSGWPCSWR
jgi:hypothetical protein